MNVSSELLKNVTAITVSAGAIALSHRRGSVSTKDDGSPVTAADRACDAFIRRELLELSTHRVISEETGTEDVDGGETFWLVDPLDGTKEFIKESGEFTVNIALIEDGRPTLGVVHAPALGVTYYGASGVGVFRQHGDEVEPIRVSPAPERPRVVVSRDHIGSGEAALIEKLGNVELKPMGSSLKFCAVAEGRADLYPRYGRTFEWDTAAAQCVLELAGGTVATAALEPLRYGKPQLANPSFIAYGDPTMRAVLNGCW